jgi:hypothetical protein
MNKFTYPFAALALSVFAILTGCNSGGGMGGGPGGGEGMGGGPGGGDHGGVRGDRPKPPQMAAGELSEYQVLGISIYRQITESDITKRLGEPHKFALHTGSCIMLAQSGAETPDKALVLELAKHFSVLFISGVPDSEPADDPFKDDQDDAGPGNARGRQTLQSVRLDKALRLAAAKAGADTILVVWTRSAGKGIPGVRAAVIDVETGKWEIVSPLADEKPAGADVRGKPKKPDKSDAPAVGLPPDEKAAEYAQLADTLAEQARGNLQAAVSGR